MISFTITGDHVHDAKEWRKILEDLRGKVKRIFGEDAIIPTRNNASSRSREWPARARIVRHIRKDIRE